MHGVQRVGLVVVASLVVPHVDGEGGLEGGEEVVGGWKTKAQKKSLKMFQTITGRLNK